MEEYHRHYTKQDVERAFNSGLESAIFVLEKAEELSPDGIQYMVESLRKFIRGSEKECPSQLIQISMMT